MSERIAEATALTRRVNRIVLVAAVALAVVAAVGVWLVVEFVAAERSRDLRSWQDRMAIVADSRAAAVSEWVEQQYGALRGLAENQSLQLYMTELSLGVAEEEGEPAELTYLRNLLTVTAERTGFEVPLRGAEVPANVERPGLAGIALTDPVGNPVVRSPGMPQPSPGLRQAIAVAAGGGRGLQDLHLGPGEELAIGFAVPIYAVQDETGRTEAIGTVVGLRLVGDELFARLKQPGETLATAETYLVRSDGTTVEYLSPLADGSKPLRRTLALDTAELAAAFVLDSPGGFAIKRGYAGGEVLVTGRALAMTPWYLVRTVGTEEALTEIETRSTAMLVVFLLIIVLVAAALVAVWRHATSLREAQAAERYRITAELFTNVTEFLRTITDNLPNQIFALDRDGRYTFANTAAAGEVGLHPREMVGKLMSSVLGPVRARLFQRINDAVIDEQASTSEVHRFEDDGNRRVVRSNHLPLPKTTLRPDGALVLLDDLTEVSAERDRRERILRQLVQTLMTVVDRRDPYSANHSARVAEVARAIAAEMDLPQVAADTVEFAGSLINLGKILVPSALLTKTDDLTDEERETLRQSVQHSADLLEGVEFDGPVVESIREMQERWDGSGPRGLAGEDIEMGGRVLAVANAFVGMVSARAYRDAMSFNRACAILQEGAGTAFDRRPVSALVNHLDNRGGRAQWAHYGDRPEGEGETPGEA